MYVCCIFGNAETQVLHGLVKRWLEELKDDMEETPQAVFLFRYPIINSVKHIYCNFYASANQITDGFPSCQVIKVIYTTSCYLILESQWQNISECDVFISLLNLPSCDL
jgi:hypothetical protein